MWSECIGVPCDQEQAFSRANKAVLCWRHFATNQFTNAAKEKLNRNAVPSSTPVSPPPQHFAAIPSTSVSSFIPSVDISSVIPSVDISPCHSSPSTPNTPRKQKSARKSILKEIDEMTVEDLTPRKRKLYQKLRGVYRSLYNVKARLKSSRAKRTLLPVSEFRSITSNLSREGDIMLQGILNKRKRKPRGRRYTHDEKLVYLSLLKRSPKAYRLFRMFFPLPTVRTLQRILNQLVVRPGINDQVMDSLKTYVQNLNVEDRVCSLMFDEMSLRENMHFNRQFDCIEGFEDYANHGRTRNVANQALVFMVRGLRLKWKQPVAFYFSHNNTRSEILKQLLLDVLTACQDAGLTVVATVCDMGGNNVRTLRELGSTVDRPVFLHNGVEIATIFDPPHLLKCTRNLFKKHDVECEVNVSGNMSTEIAKWGYIRKLFEIDCKNARFRAVPKLTEECLNTSGASAMKVGLAARVMSYSVASGIDSLVSNGELKHTLKISNVL